MNKAQFLNWLQPQNHQKPLVMGILNITPDSFYDGNKYKSLDRAYKKALEMIDEGVDIIDIGGESSKPNATPISLDEELERVIPIITKIRSESDICISIDTRKPCVMSESIKNGATLINDICALTCDGAIKTASELNVPVVLMHMQGDPQSMQINPTYKMDIVDEINMFFEQRITACLNAGISRGNLILDPGFGFGKKVNHNLDILRGLDKFKKHCLPILLGVSRKSTIGAILNKKPNDRLAGSLAMTAFALMHGASIIRAHDVAETLDVLNTLRIINTGSEVNE